MMVVIFATAMGTATTAEFVMLIVISTVMAAVPVKTMNTVMVVDNFEKVTG